MTFWIKLQMLIEKLPSSIQIQFQMHLKSIAIASNTVRDCFRSSIFLSECSNHKKRFCFKHFLHFVKLQIGLRCIFKIQWLEILRISMNDFLFYSKNTRRCLLLLWHLNLRRVCYLIWWQKQSAGIKHLSAYCSMQFKWCVCKQIFGWGRKNRLKIDNFCLHLTFNVCYLHFSEFSLTITTADENVYICIVYSTNSNYVNIPLNERGSPVFSMEILHWKGSVMKLNMMLMFWKLIRNYLLTII